MIKYLEGNINTFIAALGAKEGSKDILKLVEIVSSDFDVDELSYQDEYEIYYLFYNRGVEFYFKKIDGECVLYSVFFYLVEIEGYFPYPFVHELICNFKYGLSKDDIISFLGEPDFKGCGWVRYFYNGKNIHFEFNESSKLSQISIFI
ncbi:TPA: hypothetical protein RNY37_002081 [Pasteurella multocida]|uniref:hypothetical protein n=1 Tax=Pasteurella multocida TaxID=747 RepID=UPI002879658F|nr:hypothetical protein [Pasteurella multocida]